MKNNKKIIVIITCVLINLAIMACHIPLVSKSIEAEGDATEIPQAKEAEATKSVSSTPTQIVSTDSSKKQIYYGDGVEITLPDTFIVGDAEDIEALLEEEALLNSEHVKGVETMFDNFKEDILLWGYDTNPTGEGKIGLFVMKNEQFGGMSLMIISAFSQSLIGSQVEIVEQEIITIGDRKVLRFLTSSGDLEVAGSQAFYIFNEDGKLWIIGFFTNTELVQDRLEDFDDAVASFKILEGE